jgi:hypothetical protein
MEVLHWFVEATSVSGLGVYCAGMTVIMGALAWAHHRDRRIEMQEPQQVARTHAWPKRRFVIFAAGGAGEYSAQFFGCNSDGTPAGADRA